MKNILSLTILISLQLATCISIQAAEKPNSSPPSVQPANQRQELELVPNLDWGIGISLVDHSQVNTSKITQLWTHLQLTGYYPLSPELNLDGRSSLGFFTLSKSGSNLELRLFELGIGLSYRKWIQSDEGFSPTLGYQYETTLSSDELGFKNIHGPYGDLAYRFKINKNQLLGLGVGYSCFTTDSTLSTTNNELTIRAAYTWQKRISGDSNLTLEGKMKRMSLHFKNGGVGAYVYYFNFIRDF